MRSVQVYVEGMRLELFQDENITVNSSQQNINDIASVMTDYSQTFNIPASNNNNRGQMLSIYMIVTEGSLIFGQLLLGAASPMGFELFLLSSLLIVLRLTPNSSAISYLFNPFLCITDITYLCSLVKCFILRIFRRRNTMNFIPFRKM